MTDRWWERDADRIAALKAADDVFIYRSSPSDLATDVVDGMRRCSRHRDALTQFMVALFDRMTDAERFDFDRYLTVWRGDRKRRGKR